MTWSLANHTEAIPWKVESRLKTIAALKPFSMNTMPSRYT